MIYQTSRRWILDYEDEYQELWVKEHNKQEVVTAFSGLLEMSRRNKVITNQESTFSDILVEKRKK